jgi:hypothetical protein
MGEHLPGYEAEDMYYNKLMEENIKIFDTYPKGEIVKFCRRCGLPLVYGTASYEQGYHEEDCRRTNKYE